MDDEFEEKQAEATSDIYSQRVSDGEAPARTEEFPSDLPMQYPYDMAKFYVCECYTRYCDLVLHDLFTRNKRCVTITGSPGTGKSIFYMYVYFFNHFQREEQYRGFTIITASFTMDSELDAVAVFKDHKQISKLLGPTKFAWFDTLSEIDEHPVIHLYDGPPKTHPKLDKMTTLYMPLWDADELLVAAKSLRIDLVITRAVMDERIGIFG
ncbi:hypothetical protein PC116_g17480 [Phytophthora cactorum]|uniref:P-loop containing nucleoside triphosphate hydrolase n=1 Tax=Phytophthora cactorum TaxID=29920 RepID=A0A8T1KFD3_9STRA|nr:hypothetical protein Pcac1_g7312 [Phytophthora cactorum]KAG2816484.1 hypothetical protein PC112_g13445 [Phytophthora cactorum]KAG2818498.1 hypothetical protein PC111_g12289 [Phytophthora cactorum]KAG2853807.1 hypothetical protein PC113_g13853 [Phytophthora cactorum]KAG2897640.1 hypothetical protein PC114_g14594 [Phytophthora cactorum]